MSAPSCELERRRQGVPGRSARRGCSTTSTSRIERGELVAIVGPSGSGKSTLLNIVGTLDRPTEGTVAVAGHDTSSLTDSELSGLRSREIGFVFQQFFLLSGMTAVDNVADGLLYTGTTAGRAPRAGRARRWTGSASTTGSTTTRRSCPAASASGSPSPGPWSGQPSIVLADEPTGNLDSALERRDHRAAARAARRRAPRSS